MNNLNLKFLLNKVIKGYILVLLNFSLMVLVEDLFRLGFLLILSGFFIVFLATILAAFTGKTSGKVKSGGVVFIGPIPIIFGSDVKTIKTLIFLVLALMVFVFFLIFFPTLVWR